MIQIPSSDGHVDPPAFLVPASFQPMKFLPAGLRNRADDARWIVSTVARKMAYGDTDEEDYARLHSDILKRVMAKRNYAAVARALVEQGVFDPLAPYQAGWRSYGYRLTGKYLADRPKPVKAKNKAIINRIIREHLRIEQEQRRHWLALPFPSAPCR